MAYILTEIPQTTAYQQPEWDNRAQAELVRELLALCEPLVNADDVLNLRSQLAHAASGALQVVQAGDCAEDPAECTAGHVQRKAELIDLLAGTMEEITGKPTLRVGRLGGQFAKPRTRPSECIDGVEFPTFRGHMINRPEPDYASRRHDPLRILTGYIAAGKIMRRLGWSSRSSRSAPAPHQLGDLVVWTSHEALLLDYEMPMIRELADGRHWLSSTHWPWIGERTRQPDGAHVAMLAHVVNPVACKVGPGVNTDEIVELCGRLDPDREPGRLSLVARMGAEFVQERLPALVRAVRSAGHPVIWLCDPMHGNTVATEAGKTRFVQTMTTEIRGFLCAVDQAGGVAGGLHLETTPDDVVECVTTTSEIGSGAYTTLCDPRLNARQAMAVVAAWSSTEAPAKVGPGATTS